MCYSLLELNIELFTKILREVSRVVIPILSYHYPTSCDGLISSCCVVFQCNQSSMIGFNLYELLLVRQCSEIYSAHRIGYMLIIWPRSYMSLCKQYEAHRLRETDLVAINHKFKETKRILDLF